MTDTTDALCDFALVAVVHGSFHGDAVSALAAHARSLRDEVAALRAVPRKLTEAEALPHGIAMMRAELTADHAPVETGVEAEVEAALAAMTPGPWDGCGAGGCDCGIMRTGDLRTERARADALEAALATLRAACVGWTRETTEASIHEALVGSADLSAAHDARVRAEALEEAADRANECEGRVISDWLRSLAETPPTKETP